MPGRDLPSHPDPCLLQAEDIRIIPKTVVFSQKGAQPRPRKNKPSCKLGAFLPRHLRRSHVNQLFHSDTEVVDGLSGELFTATEQLKVLGAFIVIFKQVTQLL